MTDHDVVVVGAGLRGPARRAGARAPRARRRRAGRRGPAGRPGRDRRRRRVPLDRGFQVLNTTTRRCVPPPTSRPGPAPVRPRRGDPRRRRGAAHVRRPAAQPGLAWPTAVDGLVSAARQGAPRRVDGAGRRRGAAPQRAATRIGRSAAATSPRPHLDGPVVERVLRPFLSGVLGERGPRDVGGVRAAGLALLRARHDRRAERGHGRAACTARGPPAGRACCGRGGGSRPGRAGPCGWTARRSARARRRRDRPGDGGRAAPAAWTSRLHTLTTYHHAAPTPPAAGPRCTSTGPAARSPTPSS